MTRLSEIEIDRLKKRVPLEELVQEEVVLRKAGTELVGLCPFHTERSGSFYVNPKKGLYRCYGCGEKGDHFTWLKRMRGLEFGAALRRLSELANMPELIKKRAGRPEDTEVPDSEAELRVKRVKQERAIDIWQRALPAAGTLVETYLRCRGITLPPPPTLRYVPDLYHEHLRTSHPGMVGVITDVERNIVGIHRTYLTPDGTDRLRGSNAKTGEQIKGKLMLGHAWGGAIRFAAPAETMAIGEGIETCLSVMESTPGLAVWAALSLGNIAGGGKGYGEMHPERADVRLPSVHPDPKKPGISLPDICRRIILLLDNDNKDPRSADAQIQRAIARFRQQGREVSVVRPPVGMDFNDYWRSLQKAGECA